MLMKLIYSCCLLVAVAALAAAGSAKAAVGISLSPVDDAFATDQPNDGVFDLLFPSSPANIVGGSPNAEYRSALEFQLTSIPLNSIINSATITLREVAASGSGGSVGVNVHAYVGNGVVELSDMYVNHQVAGPVIVNLGVPPPPIQFDVTNAINGFYTSGATFAGFMLRGPPNDFALQLGSNDNPNVGSRPTLGIVYTVVPEPSTLMLLALGAVGLLIALASLHR